MPSGRAGVSAADWLRLAVPAGTSRESRIGEPWAVAHWRARDALGAAPLIGRFSLVDAEHALGYPGDLDLAPDRAPLRELVVTPQRGEAAEPAGPARVRRVGGIEPALHHGEPGLAVRAFQLPAVGHAVGEPQGRLAARLELDELGPAGVQLEPAHREAAAHIRLDVHVGAEPPCELLRLGHRVEHLLRCRVDHYGRAQLAGGEVALGRQLTAGQI